MADKLSHDAVQQGIADTDWRLDADTIVRDAEFDDFAAALDYVNRVGAKAEEANHHPDILVHGWNKVRLTLVTHDVGGLTQADVDMAHTLESV